jgi:hypothetical protein
MILAIVMGRSSGRYRGLPLFRDKSLDYDRLNITGYLFEVHHYVAWLLRR